MFHKTLVNSYKVILLNLAYICFLYEFFIRSHWNYLLPDLTSVCLVNYLCIVCLFLIVFSFCIIYDPTIVHRWILSSFIKFSSHAFVSHSTQDFEYGCAPALNNSVMSVMQLLFFKAHHSGICRHNHHPLQR